MLDDKQLEDAVQDLIMDICEVMYRRGYDMVPVGAMMRLVGVGDEKAAAHDGEFFALDHQFETMLHDRSQSRKKTKKAKRITSDGATIH
jgi:hypothetical protein